MIVDGYHLVRPGRERAMRRALRTRRAVEVIGSLLGALLGMAAGGGVLALALPGVLHGQGSLPRWATVIWPSLIALVLAAAVAAGGWFASLWLAERFHLFLRARLTRDAFPLRDRWGEIPDAPGAVLWALMDRYEDEGAAAFEDFENESSQR